MKYIRTKENGICEVEKEDLRTICYHNSHVSGCLWKDDVKYQTADTIEELCDEFIGVANNFHNYYEDYEEMKKYYRRYKNEVFYGAIWTDKGLIYVAKMNFKGELKLL